MKTFLLVIAAGFGVVLVALVFSMLLAYPIMLLWNGLLPALFGFKVITFWQAVGLYFLIHLLFPSSSSFSSSKK